MTKRYADQRAHDTSWMTAQERNGYNNPNCDGNGSGKCTPGEVKRYPTGENSAVILCHTHWNSENYWRSNRATETGHPEDWPQEDWDTAWVLENT